MNNKIIRVLSEIYSKHGVAVYNISSEVIKKCPLAENLSVNKYSEITSPMGFDTLLAKIPFDKEILEPHTVIVPENWYEALWHSGIYFSLKHYEYTIFYCFDGRFEAFNYFEFEAMAGFISKNGSISPIQNIDRCIFNEIPDAVTVIFGENKNL